jgi:hypothetical protein
VSVTLYTVARCDSGSDRFNAIGHLMTDRSFINRLVQDGIDRRDAAEFQRDVSLNAFSRVGKHEENGVTHSLPFTRELGAGTRRARYRVIATRVQAPTIPTN